MNDKLKHFFAAIAITWAVLVASHIWLPISYNWDLLLACLAATAISAGKEIIWDKWLGKGTPELMDFFWGFVGSVVGPAIWLVCEMILGVSEPLPW